MPQSFVTIIVFVTTIVFAATLAEGD